MITFFTILFSLILLNAILLIFSVNGAKDNVKKSINSAENTVAKVLPKRVSEPELKKAV